MDLWLDLEARYSARMPDLQRREDERQLRAALHAEYTAWSESVPERALCDLLQVLETRRRQLGWLAEVPLELSSQRTVPLEGACVAALSARLWSTTVHVYVQRSVDAPPAIHLLRQWGGYHRPRMACVPGAWLAKLPNGGYVARRFDEGRATVSLDELGALALSLLLGRAGRG
jgi:hypothetical protein